MKSHENHKISNIVRVLCHYFLSKASSETHITLTSQPSSFYVQASGSVEISQTELENIKSLLKQPKTPEMEYYYDDLLLSDVSENEFALLGAMVDEVHVTYIDGVLKIALRRYLPKTD